MCTSKDSTIVLGVCVGLPVLAGHIDAQEEHLRKEMVQ